MTVMAAFALFCVGVMALALAAWFAVQVVEEVRRML